LLINRQDVIDEALTWDQTPYHHLQRCKGVGTDCIQFLVGIAFNLGIIDSSDIGRLPHYSPQWHLHRDEELLVNVMRRFVQEGKLREVSVKNRQPGDMLIFKFGRVSNHGGVFLPRNRIIHALAGGVRRVAVHGFDRATGKRLTHCFAIEGIDG